MRRSSAMCSRQSRWEVYNPEQPQARMISCNRDTSTVAQKSFKMWCIKTFRKFSKAFNLSLDLAVSTILYPRLARDLAISKPIPEDAPVTNAKVFVAFNCLPIYPLFKKHSK